MNNFKLQPTDILVNVSRGNNPSSVIKRWALSSPFEHVFMYMGQVGILLNWSQSRILRFPMLFESNGRGVVLQSLSNRYGQEVVVMRLISEHNRRRIPHILLEALRLASSSRSYYDYLCIVRFVLPRLICEKLGLPLALKWHRDPLQICSEACWEVFHRVGVDLLPTDVVPLPGDFVTDSPILEEVWRGSLSEDVVE